MENFNKKSHLPTFIFIGTGKAGSTSLYYYLNEHPEIFMSPIKETNFFSYEGGRPEFNGPGDSNSLAHKTTITHIEEYQKNFQGVTTEKAVGEVSPSYLYVPQAADRIKKYLPEVKLIAILRHPVDRAYSNFQHRINLGVEPLTDFSQAIAEEKTRIENNWAPTWHYIEQGFYYSQLKRYYDLFDRRQIKVYLFEDWLSDRLVLIQDIFKFIGVDDTFVPNVYTKYNLSGTPKSKLLNNFLNQQNIVKTVLKKVIPTQMRSQLAANLQSKNLQKLPRLSPSLRQELTQLYREDILKVQQLIDRDLSNWL